MNDANTYSIITQVTSGKVILGNDTALGTSTLNVTAVSTISTTAARTINNAISMQDNLIIDTPFNMTFNGQISGTHIVLKTSTAMATFNGNSASLS